MTTILCQKEVVVNAIDVARFSQLLIRLPPKKPKKCGYKLWVISGYVCNCEVDGEKGKRGPPIGCDAPSAYVKIGFVVLRLTNDLETNTNKLSLENYF